MASLLRQHSASQAANGTDPNLDQDHEGLRDERSSAGDQAETLPDGHDPDEGSPPERSGDNPAAHERAKALELSDVIAPPRPLGETAIALAYRLGVPGHFLAAPFKKAAPPKLLATVDAPKLGNRAAGQALRAGHFMVYGIKQPIAQVDFAGHARLAPALEKHIHSFAWLADLAASGPREATASVAERIMQSWLDANGAPPTRAARDRPPRGASRAGAWDLENTGLRVLACLVHAPLIMGSKDKERRRETLGAIVQSVAWLDRMVQKAVSGIGQMAGWAAITAAGLLLPEGKPRRLFGEAGLMRALGDLVAEDGGVLARCPAGQMLAIQILTDLAACYEAAGQKAPEGLMVMRELLVGPLLALRHGDGGLGSWQGQGAILAERVDSLLAATGIRARPLSDPKQWGYHRLAAGHTIVQFDAGPPPAARHARMGCASTLAFEMSDGACRLIVNCGGAAFAGGLVPAHIAQPLRASAAHSTLVLKDANSTAIGLNGKLGKGVETLEVERQTRADHATQVEASHDGYAQRFGLLHKRTLTLSADGDRLEGLDELVTAKGKAQRGKVEFAIRFHLARGVVAKLSPDKRSASLLTREGQLWQLSLRTNKAENAPGDAELSCEDSLWVDGEGRPHGTQQIVIEGLTSRSGSAFAWALLKDGAN